MSDRFELVFSTASVPEGVLAKGRLESEGIPVLMKGEVDGPYRMGPVHLFVPEGFVIQARLALEATIETEDDEDPVDEVPAD